MMEAQSQPLFVFSSLCFCPSLSIWPSIVLIVGPPNPKINSFCGLPRGERHNEVLLSDLVQRRGQWDKNNDCWLLPFFH